MTIAEVVAHEVSFVRRWHRFVGQFVQQRAVHSHKEYIATLRTLNALERIAQPSAASISEPIVYELSEEEEDHSRNPMMVARNNRWLRSVRFKNTEI